MNEHWEVIGESMPSRRRITPIPVPYNIVHPAFADSYIYPCGFIPDVIL